MDYIKSAIVLTQENVSANRFAFSDIERSIAISLIYLLYKNAPKLPEFHPSSYIVLPGTNLNSNISGPIYMQILYRHSHCSMGER